MKIKSNIKPLSQIIDEQYGERGTSTRDEFEEGYQSFKLGAMIHEAQIEKGLTQEELAIKCGTTKSYISRIENNIKEVRISTLQKIVEYEQLRVTHPKLDSIRIVRIQLIEKLHFRIEKLIESCGGYTEHGMLFDPYAKNTVMPI